MFKNGKLFGKVNVIDLLVILVIIAAVVAGAVFLFYKPQQNTDTIIMKYYIEEVDDFVAEKAIKGFEASMEEGAAPLALYDDSYLVDLGFAVAIETGPSVSYGGTTDGVYTLGSKEGYQSMIITGEVEGKKTDLGCEVAGKKYGVGHSFVLRAGDAKLYLRVYDIQLKSDYEAEEAEKAAAGTKTGKVRVTLYTPDIEDYVYAGIGAGDTVKNLLGNTIGAVSAIHAEPSEMTVYAETENGLEPMTREGCSAVTIECEADGILCEDGVEIDGKVYGIGSEMELRVGMARMTAKIKEIAAING